MTTVGTGSVVVLDVLVDVLVDDVTVFTGAGGSSGLKSWITVGLPMMMTSPNVVAGTDDVDEEEEEEEEEDEATVDEVVEVVEVVDELAGVVSSVEAIVESVSPPSKVTEGEAGVSSN